MAEDDLEKSAKRKGLRGTFGSAREVIGGSLDKVSGTAFRRQFEQFTNVVETTVVGIHRDQSELDKRLENTERLMKAAQTTVDGIRRDRQELDKRLEKLERSTPAVPPTSPSQKRIVVALVFSVTAVILAIVAVVVVVSQ